MPFKINFFLDHCLIRCKLKLRYNLAPHRLSIYWSLGGMQSKEEEVRGGRKTEWQRQTEDERWRGTDREHFRGEDRCILHAQWEGLVGGTTFRGAFRASGNSLSSSRSQRCINCCTIGFSGLTIWNPEMLAPPAKTLSRLTFENPWEQNKSKEKEENSCTLFFFERFFF